MWIAAESDKLWLYNLMPVDIWMFGVAASSAPKLSWNVLNAVVSFPAKSN